MNLLLVEEHEVRDRHVLLSGRRAHHIRSVLKKGPGDKLEAGLVDRGLCEATIVSDSDATMVLVVGDVKPCQPPRTHVILAVPRPKVISRVVAAASSFGVRSLTLVNAWRVEKSYFDSPRLAAARLRQDAILGCEQGEQVFVPELRVFRRFVPFVEDELPRVFPGIGPKLVLHPEARIGLGEALFDVQGNRRNVLTALGPEGGWIASELDTLSRAGFTPVTLGTGTLKTEVALAAALGQLALLNFESATPPG